MLLWTETSPDAPSLSYIFKHRGRTKKTGPGGVRESGVWLQDAVQPSRSSPTRVKTVYELEKDSALNVRLDFPSGPTTSSCAVICPTLLNACQIPLEAGTSCPRGICLR